MIPSRSWRKNRPTRVPILSRAGVLVTRIPMANGVAARRRRALTARGRPAARAKSTPPKARPRNIWPTIIPVWRSEFARASESLGTTRGMSDWVAGSAKASAMPYTSAATQRVAMEAAPVRIVRARITRVAARMRCAVTIIATGRVASTITPAICPNTSADRKVHTVTRAISAVSSVRRIASRGSATSRMPSPRAVRVDDAHRRRKLPPRRGSGIVVGFREYEGRYCRHGSRWILQHPDLGHRALQDGGRFLPPGIEEPQLTKEKAGGA